MRSSRHIAGAVALVFGLAGCARDKAAPRVDSVTPDVVSTYLDTTAVITGRNFYVETGASLDGNGTSVDARFRVLVGSTELDAATITRLDNERLSVVVPAGFDPGAYDLTVVTPAGASVTLHDSLTVVSDPIGLHVRVESAPGGAGVPIGAQLLTTDEPLLLHAVGRDDLGTYVTDVAVTWSVGAIGLIDAGPSTSATFDPVLVGTGEIAIANPWAASLTGAGPLTVLPGRAAVLGVDPVAVVVSADDAPFAFTVTATDADGNATTDVGTLAWTVSSGPISAIDGASGTFTPTVSGTGVVRVTSSFGPQQTADVVVLPGQAATLAIAPATRTFSADDAAFTFGYEARDADGNLTADVGTLTWSIASGPITAIDSGTGTFTPGTAGSGTLGLASSHGPTAESGAVIVVPGAAAALVVSPDTLVANADAGATAFSVSGADADGNPTSNLGTITWSIASGPITAIDAGTGSFTPGTAGSGTVRAASSHGVFDDSGVVTVDPGRATVLSVAPDTLTINADDAATAFAVAGADADGNPTADLGTITWSISAGAISAISTTSGAFTPVTAGTGTVRASSSYGVFDDSGTVTVSAGKAAVLAVSPDTLTINADDAATAFTVTAVDADGNATSDLGVVTWSIASGPITAVHATSGAFTPMVAGTGSVRATSSHGPFDDSGSVTVVPGKAVVLAVAPDSLSTNADAAPTGFSVVGTDGDGNTTPDVGTITWSIASGPITAIDATTGSFAPTVAGTGTIRATSSHAGLSDDSGAVTVVPGKAAALVVAPDTLSATVGGASVPFGATGTDADGNPTTDLGSLTWSIASGPIASIAAATGVFTPTAAGTGSIRAASSHGPSDDTGAVTVQTAAALTGAFTVPAVVSTGQNFTVTLRVSNGGASGANGVTPTALTTGGSSSATLLSGPSPASANIAGGAFADFSWSYRAGPSGTLTFSGMGNGMDASTGNPVSTGSVGSGSITVQRPAALAVTLSIPATISRNDTFSVTMNVTNVGDAAATGVTPSALTVSGTGAATLASGPTPASFGLGSGATSSFTWTYTATTVGSIQFGGSASGADANSGAMISSAVGSSNAGEIQSVKLLVTNPFADGTAFSYVARYAGRVFLGPRADGGGAVSHDPDGSNPTSRGFSIPKDNTGGNRSLSAAPGPFPSLGFPGCTPDIDTLPNACGPDNEDARGVFTSGTFGGAEWLLATGGRSAKLIDHVYLTQSTGATLAFRYVDLNSAAGNGTGAVSAAHFFNDHLYLGFTSNGGNRPHLIRLKTTPPAPGLETTAVDVDELDADSMPGFKTNGDEMIDWLTDFNGRLYVVNKGNCIRATILEPGPYALNVSDWASCTPSNAAYGAKVSRVTTKGADLEPSDKTVPQMAVYNGRLYLARNTTAGPQIWGCTPAMSGIATQCDPGDWALVAANSSGDTQLSQFDNPNNTDVTMLVATPTALVVGYNNATDGVVLFSSTAAAPLTRADFRGAASCTADNHPGTCAGLGGNGFGDPANVKRIYDAKALVFGAASPVYVTAGRTGGAVRVYRIAD